MGHLHFLLDEMGLGIRRNGMTPFLGHDWVQFTEMGTELVTTHKCTTLPSSDIVV